MAGAVVCPTCGKRFAAKPELMGKRVRCPKCREPFTVTAETEEELDLAPPDVPEPPAMSTPPPLTGGRGGGGRAGGSVIGYGGDNPAKGAWGTRRKLELTGRERAWMKFGLSLLGFGLLGTVLPFLGLKFRQVKNDEDQQAVAIGVAVLGVVVVGLVFLRRYFKYAMMIIGGGVALMIGGCSLLLMTTRPGGCMSSRPGWPPPQPGIADRPGAPGPRGGPPAGWPGPGRGSGPMTYDELVAKHGDEKVIRVRLTAPSVQAAKDQAMLKKAHVVIHTAGVTYSMTGTRGNVVEVVAAPVADIDALAKRVEALGPVTVDRAAHRVDVVLTSTTATAPAK